MAKGASIKFTSYEETVPQLLNLLKLDRGLKQSNKIVLKPSILDATEGAHPSLEYMEQIIKFCLDNMNPNSELLIAEGADGYDTHDLFEEIGYKKLAEKYDVGLVDLNNTELEYVKNEDFVNFEGIYYPKILLDSFLISITKLSENDELGITGSVAGMLGTFPSSEYRGFLTKRKTKLRKSPITHAVHDIMKCKAPDFAIIDASDKGFLLAGLPLDIDKHAAKILGKEWRSIPYISLMEDSNNGVLKQASEAEEVETEEDEDLDLGGEKRVISSSRS